MSRRRWYIVRHFFENCIGQIELNLLDGREDKDQRTVFSDDLEVLKVMDAVNEEMKTRGMGSASLDNLVYHYREICTPPEEKKALF